jgi:hypothetical protein
MPRDVLDADGITWTCIQAFAGLGNDPEKTAAARVEGGRVQVVCTPSGGARSVRLHLSPDWETDVSDDGLLGTIQESRTSSARAPSGSASRRSARRLRRAPRR